MARIASPLQEDLRYLLQRNGRLLTFFAAALIIFTGVAVVNNPAHWWVAPLAIVVFFAAAFLFLNARGFVKMAVALILLFLTAGYAFKLGSLMDDAGRAGSVWFSLLCASFFGCLSVSYLKPSSKSRWGTVTITTLLSFASAFLLGLMGVPLLASIILSTLLGIVLFVLFYYFMGRGSYDARSMPEVGMTEVLQEELYQAALSSGRGAWKRTVHGRRSVVVWNDHEAFQLLTVELEQKLGVGGRRAEALTHRERPITSWLLQLSYGLAPLREVKGADLFLVLLDATDRNGKTARTIGLSVPDSQKQVPVGLLPSRELLKRKAYGELLDKVEAEYGPFALALSRRQLAALDKHLPEDPSETPASKEEEAS